jgi:hypothetical protein
LGVNDEGMALSLYPGRRPPLIIIKIWGIKKSTMLSGSRWDCSLRLAQLAGKG